MSLRLESVAKYEGGTPAIYPTSLQLEKGSLNVLLGPTLAGKTSLMRIMAGLDTPNEGSITWNGTDVTRTKVQSRDVAMVYQQFINYPTLSVYENIASPLRIKKFDKRSIDQAVHEIAEILKLTPFLKRKPLELSGGQQQRCALARSLVKQAGLVLLDEPLANLDYKLREELREEFPRIFKSSGAIFVYATTEPEEALLLGGNTATMWQGRITQFGSAPEVYREPQDVTTARVYSNPPMNFFNALKKDGMLEGADSRVQLTNEMTESLSDSAYQIGFRAGNVHLVKGADDDVEFNVHVTDGEITGSQTYIYFEKGAYRWVGLIAGIHHLKSGTAVTIYIPQSAFYVFNQQGQLVSAAFDSTQRGGV